jgi:hypothetical protein
MGLHGRKHSGCDCQGCDTVQFYWDNRFSLKTMWRNFIHSVKERKQKVLSKERIVLSTSGTTLLLLMASHLKRGIQGCLCIFFYPSIKQLIFVGLKMVILVYEKTFLFSPFLLAQTDLHPHLVLTGHCSFNQSISQNHFLTLIPLV